MIPEVNNYFSTHTLDEVTDNWKQVQYIATNPFKAWFEFLQVLENENDSTAYYIYSTAISCFFSVCNKRGIKCVEDGYTDEIFSKVKKLVIDDIKYNTKHGSKATRECFTDLYNNKLEYYKLNKNH